MPDVHLPQLDDPDERDHGERSAAGGEAATVIASPRPAPPPRPARGHGIGRILLEVVLISLGVFLGLAGEQWREASRHRELAVASLRRFREEIATNRQAVGDVRDFHVATQADLGRYLAEDVNIRRTTGFGLAAGFRPASFEHAGWDLALATQSLADLNPDIALGLAHAYSKQQTYAAATAAFVAAMYVHPPVDPQDPDGFWRALHIYYGDILVYEPQLLQMYDALLPQIDREIGR